MKLAIIDQARIGLALDIVDIGFVHGPGIDGAFDLFNGAVIETEGFGFQIGGTGCNPGGAGGLQRVVGRGGQESIDGRGKSLGIVGGFLVAAGHEINVGIDLGLGVIFEGVGIG